MRSLWLKLCACFLFSMLVLPVMPSSAAGITVFAAASTSDALTELAEMYQKAGHDKVTLSFASSSTLAKQIESGAPVDLFVSADVKWMNYLEEKQLLNTATRKNLLGNRLVFIVPKDSFVKNLRVNEKLDLSTLLGKDGLLAVGDPAHVPVGTYAKAALTNLQLWQQVENRLAPAKDVRAGMMLVERGEVPLGIVYASDAAISKNVRAVGVFPEDSHPPVQYPAAVLRTGKEMPAKEFLSYISTPEAARVWERRGFEVLK